MFKRFFTLFLAVSFLSINVNASTENGIKTAFDELRYSLSVEWDQKDAQFKSLKMEEFKKTVDSLGGLNHDLYVSLLKSEIKNDQLVAELQVAIENGHLSKMSEEQTINYVFDILNRSASQGSSWMGLTTGNIVGAVVLVGMLTFFFVAGSKAYDDGWRITNE